MIEIKYETPEKEVVTRIQDDTMYWKELLEHFINLLPSMGYDGINTEDIILSLHKYLDSAGDLREDSLDKFGDRSDIPELTHQHYNMNWNRAEIDIPEEDDGDDEDPVPDALGYTDTITDEEDY